MEEMNSQEIAQETPPADVFMAPSIHEEPIILGRSYTHHSPLPRDLANDSALPCVMGIDEAGRGPVLGPMVYAVFYLPIPSHTPLLATTHHFNDSKVLTPSVRSALMQTLCTEGTDLQMTCGWATRVMSARDIGAGMLKPCGGMYNLNAQAMDATIDLIKETFARGVNIQEIYIDTIGSPKVYQQKLERIFPTTKITVAKKADRDYPCVSAASVCAKVTRDAALEVCYKAYAGQDGSSIDGWGSGYPSDAKCTTWLKRNVDPLFGWGPECRFSWGTVKDILSTKGNGTIEMHWPEAEDDEQDMRMTDFYVIAQQSTGNSSEEPTNELASWFGKPVTEAVF